MVGHYTVLQHPYIWIETGEVSDLFFNDGAEEATCDSNSRKNSAQFPESLNACRFGESYVIDATGAVIMIEFARHCNRGF